MTTKITRADLAQLVGMTPKLLNALSGLFADTETAQATADGAANAASGAVGATGAIQSATVLTLSPNAAFDNERVVIFDPNGFRVQDRGPGEQLFIALVPPPDPVLTVPGPYTDDAAAAAAGVEVGGVYKQPLGLVVWRQV